MHKLRDAFGSHIASVIHLVACFDFTGADNPLYQSVNVEGTRRLLRTPQRFRLTIKRFQLPQPIEIAVNARIEVRPTLDSLLETVRACRVCGQEITYPGAVP